MTFQAFIHNGHAREPGWSSVSGLVPSTRLAEAYVNLHVDRLRLDEAAGVPWTRPSREVEFAITRGLNVGWRMSLDGVDVVARYAMTVAPWPDVALGVAPGRYQHYKGRLYHVIATGLDVAAELDVVIYRNATGRWFTRPVDQWQLPARANDDDVVRFTRLTPD